MLVVLLTFSQNVKADTSPSYLNKGDASPYAGLLFSVDDANSIRKQLIDLDTSKALNDSLNKSIDLYKNNETFYQQQKQVLLEQNDKLAKSLYEERQMTNWERAGFFVLGIAVTGLAFYGVKQLTK